jgi:hypothetical protein
METNIYKPVRFFIITYLVTLLFEIIAMIISHQPGGEGMFVSFLIPGMMAPAIIGVWMIRSSKSKEMWKSFVNRLCNLRLIKFGRFLTTLLIVPAALVIAALISIAFGGDSSQIQLADGFSLSAGMLPTLIILILAAVFEEVGWRGYAMDSLQVNRTYFTATLIFAGLWALWHLPLFFIQGTYQNEIVNENFLYAVNFFVSIIPMAFIISWVWELNSRSITAVILFHFFFNLAQEALNVTQATKCIETVILIIFAVVVVSLNKSLFFDKPDHQKLINGAIEIKTNRKVNGLL